jgi:hypothetical protein
MADIITNTVVISRDNVIERYLVYYTLDSGSGKFNDIEIQILSSELEDESDLDEVKEKANVKAATRKAQWVSSLVVEPVEQQINDLNGSVTLE